MRTPLYCLLLLLLATSLDAGDYCSLIVKVVDPHGQSAETRITVDEPGGRTITKENQPGGAKFCDLGISPVTIYVGDPACNQVVVRNAPVDWNETLTTEIIYDREPCLFDAPPVAACAYLLRFADSQQNPIKGVEFKYGNPSGEMLLKADKYGRVMVHIAAWREMVGKATAAGYLPEEVRIRCTPQTLRLEKRVILKKAP